MQGCRDPAAAPAHYRDLHHIKDIILPLHRSHTQAHKKKDDDDDDDGKKKTSSPPTPEGNISSCLAVRLGAVQLFVYVPPAGCALESSVLFYFHPTPTPDSHLIILS